MILEFKIAGETPPKKNNRVTLKSGKTIPSKRHKIWHKHNSLLLNRYRGLNLQRVKIECVFFHEDNRKRDSDNQLSSVLDLLCDLKIIADDCWQNVPEITVKNEKSPEKWGFCVVKIWNYSL